MLNETFSVIFKHRDKEEDNEIFGADDDEYEDQFLENPLDSFNEMTYENGKDYYIESRLFDRKNKPIKTQLYTDQFATLQNGQCLRITINEELQEAKMMDGVEAFVQCYCKRKTCYSKAGWSFHSLKK